ncbi:MAG: metallophosphoesterase [Chitinophagaceae bacterium]|nr:metallophosphoesterase [Chitinophagaceae bacterium]
MTAPTPHIIHNNTFWLSAERCIFWEEEKILILSDLHFGKTGHFRKAGIAVPQDVFQNDLQRLLNLVQHFKPLQIIAVGDLFHSHANKELDLFIKWKENINIPFHLVKGNHDILSASWYKQANITVHQPSLRYNNFLFSHDQEITEQHDADYVFSGHIHPGVIIRGLGKQSLRFPCFYFCDEFCVLPAFSHFTGLASIEPCKSETVFAIVPKEKRNNSAASLVKLV